MRIGQQINKSVQCPGCKNYSLILITRNTIGNPDEKYPIIETEGPDKLPTASESVTIFRCKSCFAEFEALPNLSMPEKKTSEEWDKLDKYKEITVLDADGWDRKNFDYSWKEEQITEQEFNHRLAYSTCEFGEVKNDN